MKAPNITARIMELPDIRVLQGPERAFRRPAILRVLSAVSLTDLEAAERETGLRLSPVSPD